jgi:hypothetical protein
MPVILDGTLGIQTPNTIQDGFQVYARDNILGTVSESSGVPTGAIIERGSNANGEYVKYADGTLIMHRRFDSITILANTNNGITWTYPTTAIANGVVHVTPNTPNPSSYPYPLTASSVDTTSASLRVNRGSDTSAFFYASFIGRWF